MLLCVRVSCHGGWYGGSAAFSCNGTLSSERRRLAVGRCGTIARWMRLPLPAAVTRLLSGVQGTHLKVQAGRCVTVGSPRLTR